MRAAFVTLFFVLVLSPMIFTGCGSNSPDNLLVVEHGGQQGQWHVTNANLVHQFYQDVEQLPSWSGEIAPGVCFAPWYTLTFRQGSRSVLQVTLPPCGARVVALPHQAHIPDARFCQLLIHQMNIPVFYFESRNCIPTSGQP